MNDPSEKSSWTCCKRPGAESRVSDHDVGRRSGASPWTVLFCCVVILATLTWPASAFKKAADPDELFNPLLGVEYSHWLVGPIYHMATSSEIRQYQDLVTDDEAQEFIEAFWKERNKDTPVFQETPQDLFEKRSEAANKQYTENAFPGERTDRGTIYILYGEPESVTFESPRDVGDRTVEVWNYGKDAEPGLDGERPKKSFRFVEINGSTVFFAGQKLTPRERVQRRNRRF